MTRTRNRDSLSRASLIELYYFWLCESVEQNLSSKSYHLLLKVLFHKEFRWIVPNDDNRSYEGKKLRERFCNEEGYEFKQEYFDMGCSMLELIVGMAYRCESIVPDISMKEWFWTMISNARLDRFEDSSYYDCYEGGQIDDILEKIIERDYHRNGHGGFFPLKKQKKDQRKVELWYQMSSYLVENYYIV